MSIILLLSCVSTLAYGLELGIVIILHFLPTGYNPIKHAVSDYAVGKFSNIYRWRLWCSAIGALALAGALALRLEAGNFGKDDLELLLLMAPVRVAMSFFPVDLEGQPLTRNGRLHYF